MVQKAVSDAFPVKHRRRRGAAVAENLLAVALSADSEELGP